MSQHLSSPGLTFPPFFLPGRGGSDVMMASRCFVTFYTPRDAQLSRSPGTPQERKTERHTQT